VVRIRLEDKGGPNAWGGGRGSDTEGFTTTSPTGRAQWLPPPKGEGFSIKLSDLIMLTTTFVMKIILYKEF